MLYCFSRFVIDQMKEDDMLGITTYSNQAHTPLPLQRMLPASKDLANNIVDHICVDGGTALYAGLEEGIRQMGAAPPSQTAVSAVFMCTDGQANVSFFLPLRHNSFD